MAIKLGPGSVRERNVRERLYPERKQAHTEGGQSGAEREREGCIETERHRHRDTETQRHRSTGRRKTYGSGGITKTL